MRAIVGEGLLIPARLAFDCFVLVFVLILFWSGRLRFLFCELCDRSKYQSWIYLRDLKRFWTPVSDDVLQVPSFDSISLCTTLLHSLPKPR
jgi:hypothetical protein